MKRKIIGISVVMMMLALSVSAISARGAYSADSDLAIDSAYLNWGDTVTIRVNASVWGGATLYWNGTIYLNLEAPSGTNYTYNWTLALTNADRGWWANTTFEPREAGRWEVRTNATKFSGNPDTGTFYINADTNAFTVERQGQWLNRVVGDWTGLVWLIFGVTVLLLLIILVFNRVGKGAKD